MTVINPSSISGITSITMPSGDGNVLTIHTNDGTERFRIDSSGNVKVGSACTISQDGDVFFTGVCTATTLAGSGANLTALPAANLTGALPAISGANLTGIAATDNVRTGILDVAGISTFRNTVNIGAAVTISESGIEASGIGITVANINGAQLGGRRNIIINGAMEVAQRGTTETGSAANGYSTVDRIQLQQGGTDDYPETAQGDVASGTTPYTEGFRKTFKVTNGNQSTGGQAGDELAIRYSIEAQDVAKCGWNYKSASSFITLSFWVKSSVAQNFYGYLLSLDGTMQRYAFETGSLSADTWTKVTKTIPGNSNIAIDNNNDEGFRIEWRLYAGTDYTDSGVSLNTWAAFAGGTRTPDSTSTWYTTNDATFELTGLQLEVGSQATPFEHRSYGEELGLCQRYYRLQSKSRASGRLGGAENYVMMVSFPLSPQMRNTPTVAMYGSASYNSNVSSVATINITLDHVGFTANISDGSYYYYNNGWTADAEL
jgi:hypothetical protein